MDKMGLIVFGETGHVLGAFTRTADPDGPVTAEQVVGSGLTVRDPDSGDTRVTVQPQHLKVESLDRRDDVILAHREYVVEGGAPRERAALTSPAVSYNLASRILTLTVPAPAEDGKAWVQIDDGQSQPVVVPIDLVAAVANGTAQVTLTPGDYGVLALVPERRAYVDTLTVT